jgi:hypothetical protein
LMWCKQEGWSMQIRSSGADHHIAATVIIGFLCCNTHFLKFQIL